MAKTLGTERHKALISMLIEKREAAGLTQAELADALGEYQSFVARLESGQRRIDVVEFIAISHILHFNAATTVQALEEIPDNTTRQRPNRAREGESLDKTRKN